MKMKKIILLSIGFFFLIHVLHGQTFNILNFGATPDSSKINTLYIQNAIDSCFTHGGGTVYVPSGIFITGTVELKSNVNLFLENGAELRGSPNIEDYKVYQDTVRYGIIHSYKASGVSITGQGTINGNEEVFFDWDKTMSVNWDFGTDIHTRQGSNFRSVKSGIDDGPVIWKYRPKQMVLFSECKNVLIRDVNLIKSPHWSLHFANCNGVVASGLKIWGSLLVPNNDGINITACNNVIISDCNIRTGDDALIIRGNSAGHVGYNNIRHISDNIIISNCNLQSRSSGIRMGFIDHNTVRNVHFSNITITNSNRGIGIFVRGESSLENITFSQISIETRLHTGTWWGQGEPIQISAVKGDSVTLGKIKNIVFRDISCTGESGILIYGSQESIIEDIRFENLRFHLKESKLNDVAGGNIDLRRALGIQLFASDISAFYAQYVKDLSLNDVHIKWGDVKEDYFKYGIHTKEFNGLRLENIRTTPSPSNKTLPAVFVENGKGLSTNLTNKYIEKKNVE